MSENTEVKKTEKKKISKDDMLEIIVAVALGVTALLTAWASWVGSLHGGNQATNYAKANSMASDGNSRYIEAVQNYTNDLETWNKIYDYMIEMTYAEENNDTVSQEKYQWKMEQLMQNNVSPEFAEAINWALESEEDGVTPFDKEGYFDTYFADASAVLAESEAVLTEGQADNHNGDRYGLVTVFYSVVMFLLGIVGTFKNIKNKYVILAIAGVCFLVATIIMFTIPIPTGFSLSSFFK